MAMEQRGSVDTQKSGSRTFYARTELKDRTHWGCCGPITFMNQRGVFEVNMHAGVEVRPSHNEVVAITFDPETRVVERITNAFRPDLRVLMDQTSEHYQEPEIVVRGYWRRPSTQR
jgi:hypothetical protein